MNNKDIKESFDKIKPNDIQKKRMINNIIKHSREDSRTERTNTKRFLIKNLYTASVAVLCFIFVFALSFQPIVNIYDKDASKGTIYIPKTVSPDDFKDLKVENYDELYSYLSTFISESDLTYMTDGGNNSINDSENTVNTPAATPMPSVDSSKGSSNEGSNKYSDTNLQVAGVQEADIIKTDGNYIYAMSQNYLYIVSAKNGNLSIVSKISRGYSKNTNYSDHQYYYNSYFIEMYITQNRLIVLRNYIEEIQEEKSMTSTPKPTGYANDYMIPGMYYYNQKGICIEIYDISDKTKPTLVNTLGQSGDYSSSRMIGDTLYLISNHSIYNYNINKDKPETYIPQLINGGTKDFVKASDIIINKDANDSSYYSQYLMISGIDTSGEGKIISNKSLLGFGSNIYASQKNLYIAAYKDIIEGNVHSTGTKLYRFSLDVGNVELEATGFVPGNILNQFSMDEYKGVFRIVTTVNSYTRWSNAFEDGIKSDSIDGIFIPPQNQQYNCLYTLNDKLEIVGKIENLAKDERVYSVRFDGDIGYFVTFRQVDPLFAVDLSDPEKPKVLSELKIPGFSEYLHMYDDGLLFGLGRDADEDSGAVGFLKLSMFDVKDPGNVTEKHKLIIKGKYYSSASYNHKAILIDSEKNIIAFPCENEYRIYSYSKDDGFKREGVIRMHRDFEYYYGEMRGLYINDYLYVVSPNGISSYNMADYSYCEKVNFPS